MDVHWNLVAQDGPYPWNPKGVRVTDFDYMRQLAGAIDHAGFAGALIATLAGGTDPWTLAAGLAQHTRRMKFIVAQYAGIISPLWLAQMAASLDRQSDGRLIINIISGNARGSPQFGIFDDHDQRYALADEYWGVFRRLMQGEKVDFEGKYVRIKGAQLLIEPVQKPYPELMFGGSSEAAMAFAAKHVDTWLGHALPPEIEARKVKAVRAAAAGHGRKIRCGLRLHVIVRETEKEAWQAAQWMYERMDRQAIDRRFDALKDEIKSGGASEMHGAVGTTALDLEKLPDDARALEISPNLWGGIALVRMGPGTTLVGDPDQVCRRLKEYEALGIDAVILSGYPHIEEAYRFADLVMPLLKAKPQVQQKRVAWV